MFKYMIGIDAGGTHSTAIAYDEQGKELGRAESGPCLLYTSDAADE